MKAVILTGGLGTRLEPATSIYNKHLVLIYDRPMLDHLVDNLRAAGFSKFCFVLGGPHANQLRQYVVKRYSRKASFALQGKPTGIATAVYAARDFVGNENFGVFLGDQFYIDSEKLIRAAREEFPKSSDDATIWVRYLSEPWHHNVVTFNANKELVNIVEKPHEKMNRYRKRPGYTMIGFHLFRSTIFDIIAAQPDSHHKGEKNLADTITLLKERGGKIKVYPFEGVWYDCGTPENVFLASQARRAFWQQHS